jgi:hypothetical protein
VSAAACFYDPSFLASMIFLRATAHGISFIVANSLQFPNATVLLNHRTSSGGVPPAVCTCPGRVFPATFWWTFGPKNNFFKQLSPDNNLGIHARNLCKCLGLVGQGLNPFSPKQQSSQRRGNSALQSCCTFLRF